MAIEPLGSVMTAQAATVVQKPAVQTMRQTDNYSNANVLPINQVDKTTAVVENAEEVNQNNTGAQDTEQQSADNEQIRKAVEQLNKKISSHSEAVFGIHEATNRVTIKIVDKTTKEVIKEIPPEKTLDMIAKVWEIAGILVDEKR